MFGRDVQLEPNGGRKRRLQATGLTTVAGRSTGVEPRPDAASDERFRLSRSRANSSVPTSL